MREGFDLFHLSNQWNHKFSNWIEWISKESSIWKILLHPIVGVESNEFWINCHRIFQICFALLNQSNRKFSNRIEQISNDFQFDSTPNSGMAMSLRNVFAHILIRFKSYRMLERNAFWELQNHQSPATKVKRKSRVSFTSSNMEFPRVKYLKFSKTLLTTKFKLKGRIV